MSLRSQLSEEQKNVCLRCNSPNAVKPSHLLCTTCIHSLQKIPRDEEPEILHICPKGECDRVFCPRCPPNKARETCFCARCHEVCCMNCAQKEHKHENQPLKIQIGVSSFLSYTAGLLEKEMASENAQLRVQVSWVNEVFWRGEDTNILCRFRLLHLMKQRLSLFTANCLVSSENRLTPQYVLDNCEKPRAVSVSPGSEVYVLDGKREMLVLRLDFATSRRFSVPEKGGVPISILAWKEDSILVLLQFESDPQQKVPVMPQARIYEIRTDGSWEAWLIHLRFVTPSAFAVSPDNDRIAVVNSDPPRLCVARPHMEGYKEIDLAAMRNTSFKRLTGVTFLPNNQLALLDGELEQITIISLNDGTAMPISLRRNREKSTPQHITSLPDGQLLVSFAGNRQLCLLNQDGSLLREFGRPHSCSVAVDRLLNVYVCYADDKKVEKYDELLLDLDALSL